VTQVEFAGLAVPMASGTWRALYARDRSSGERLSILIPPRNDVVIIRVGSRSISLEHSELARVSEALDAAREELGI
jgi:hypothetical protein